MSQIEIATKLGMKANTYSKYERTGKISCDMLLKIAEILETDVSEFLYNSDERKPQDIDGLIVTDIYERLAITAIRNLSYEEKMKIYKIIFEKFLDNDGLIR